MSDRSADAGAGAGGKRDLLRHAAATLAYRGGKAVRGAPSDFGRFRAGTRGLSERKGASEPSEAGAAETGSDHGSRTAAEVLAHIGDLLDWALSLARGDEAWRPVPPQAWDHDVRRFHDGLQRLDAYLASDRPLACSCEQLLQGPLADAFTHVGQIAMLRRLAGSPVRGENYRLADISAGRVGPEQSTPRREFD